jgi:hypothetical protein
MRLLRNVALFGLFVTLGIAGRSSVARAWCSGGQAHYTGPASQCADDTGCASMCSSQCGSGYLGNDAHCSGTSWWTGYQWDQNGYCQCEGPPPF